MLKLVINHFIIQAGIEACFNNIINNFKQYKRTLPFELPEVDDEICIALNDGSGVIVTVAMIDDTSMCVFVDNIDKDDYGITYRVQYSDINYIINFHDSSC